MSFGVTFQGFVRKHLASVVEDLQAAVKDAFGVEKRVDAKSPVGILIGVFSQPLGEAWEALEALYNSFNPDTATGASLDSLLSVTGITRQDNTHSTCGTHLSGVPGSEVPTGTRFATSNAGDEFETTQGFAFSAGACARARVQFDGSVSSAVDYTVSIGGASFTYTTSPGDDEIAVIVALAALVNDPSSPVYGIVSAFPDGVLGIGFECSYGLFFSLAVSSNLTIAEVYNHVTLTATDPGAIPAYIGKLTEIKTPISGLNYSYNWEDAVLGTSLETDAEARQRRAQSIAAPGSTTVDAIRAKLLDVRGVTHCTVLDNRTDATDANGLLPHSILPVLVGGIESDIAQVLWDHVGAGIGMNLSLATNPPTVVDSQGYDQTVGYYVATDLEMWVEVVYTLNTEEEFPTDGVALIAAAVLAVGEAHEPGQDVLPERFHGPAFSACKGIKTLVIRVKKTGGAYSASPFTVTALEVGRFASMRVVVSL